MTEIRRWDTDIYAVPLLELYYEHLYDNEQSFQWSGCNIKFLGGWEFGQLRGLESRLQNGLARVVKLPFVNDKLQDTQCACDAGLRVNGGCAHVIAALRRFYEMKFEKQPSTQLRTLLQKSLNLSWATNFPKLTSVLCLWRCMLKKILTMKKQTKKRYKTLFKRSQQLVLTNSGFKFEFLIEGCIEHVLLGDSDTADEEANY